MGFNWNSYREYASKSLDLADVPEEAKLRNYCSRVYYNCLHCLANFAEHQFGFRLPEKDAHSSLIRELKKRGRRIHAELLWEIRAIREKCDYNELYPDHKADFEKFKDCADEILKFVGCFGEKKQKNDKK